MSRDDVSDDTIVVTDARLPEVSYPFVINVIDGPSRGERLAIDPAHPSRVLVGSSRTADLTLADPAVSRRHLALEVDGKKLRLRDLGSSNGTHVGGLTVVEALLRGGETIVVGDSTLRCERGTPTQTQPLEGSRFGRMLGQSRPMRRLYPLCERLALATMPVIIEGETGTGKEILAEAIHRQGPRGRGPFVVFDCTAVAPELIEEELFGRERGTLAGTTTVTPGVFERADGGTLLIDEVADLPVDLQPSLLRALERLEVTRVGSSTPRRVDVRVLAATRRDLDRLVQQGRFLEELFHRLAGARIELPPLRDRRGDIALLARHFWSEIGGGPHALPEEVVRKWEDDAWPGNVRELRNAVTRRLALGDLLEPNDDDEPLLSTLGSTRGAIHTVSPAGDPIAAVLALDLPLGDARQRIVEEFENRYVERILAIHDGNVTRAAAAAGVARRHLQRLKARFRGE
jgi:two-component system, NtrC family, response regulator HydG